MNRPNIDLHARIDRLERQNRRLVRYGTGVIGTLALITLMSAAAPLCKTLRAERFVLEDSRGTQRMVFDAYSTPKPTVTLLDSEGDKSARLHVGDAGSIDLEVFMEDGSSSRTTLGAAPDLEGSDKDSAGVH
ncbi:MAG: hypothetical protein ACI8QZ_003069 [Chlamydiales bacterium]|jgi:hypothetical protein